MSERRVVITGMGVVSPIGIGLDSFWSSLIDGKSGIQRISSLDPSDFYCQIGFDGVISQDLLIKM